MGVKNLSMKVEQQHQAYLQACSCSFSLSSPSFSPLSPLVSVPTTEPQRAARCGEHVTPGDSRAREMAERMNLVLQHPCGAWAGGVGLWGLWRETTKVSAHFVRGQEGSAFTGDGRSSRCARQLEHGRERARG